MYIEDKHLPYYVNKKAFIASVHSKLEWMEHDGLTSSYGQHKARLWKLTELGERKAKVVISLTDFVDAINQENQIVN